MTLRSILLGVMSCLVLALPASSMNFAPAARQVLNFTVYRENVPIGHHTFEFRPQGDKLAVAIDVALEVKMLSFTAFKFRHVASELWEDGRLLKMESETNDDGDPYKVRVERQEEGLLVEVNGERKLAPPDIIPSNLWNRAVLTREKILHPILGEVMPLKVKRLGDRAVPVNGAGEVPAEGFEIAAGAEFRRELWYGPDGRLVEVGFNTPLDGSRIIYRLNGGN